MEQVPGEADKIKPLIQFIVAAIAPVKIYMMKYPDVDTTVPDNYIDLLIIISSKNKTPFTELQPVLDMAYLNDRRVACFLHNEGHVIDGLRNGHILYSLQCIPENLICDDKVTAYPVTPPEILQETKEQAYLKFEQNLIMLLIFMKEPPARKLNVPIYQYINDRIAGQYLLPSLAETVHSATL